VTATLVLGQDVDLRLEVGVRGDRAGLADDLAALDVLRLMPRSSRPTFSPARPSSSSLRNISTPVTVVLVCLASWMPTISTSSLTGEDATLDTTGDDGATTGDREDVLDGHQERLVGVALGSGCTRRPRP
jgi:hypothetical protein